jgi:DNA-directed RNA polymerase subunit delta
MEDIMASKENDMSLLEIAINLLSKKKKPQLLTDIIKDVMSSKGFKVKQAKEEAPQFILDFQSSGYFIYCGDGKWDLKDRQPTSILDKDGVEYDEIFDDDEDVIKNELKDDEDYLQIHEDDELINDHLVEPAVTEEEEEEEEEEDADDLSAEFETGDDETDELTDDNDDLAYSDDDGVDEDVADNGDLPLDEEEGGDDDDEESGDK